MCDPISAAVIGVCCCCICVGLIVAVAVIGPMLAELANAVIEVATCVNDTLGKPIINSMQEDHCKQHTEKKCPEMQDPPGGLAGSPTLDGNSPAAPQPHSTTTTIPNSDGRRLAERTRVPDPLHHAPHSTMATSPAPSGELSKEQECQILQAKCMCDIATALTAAEDESGFAVPKLKERLNPCCATFLGFEDHPVFGEFAKPAGDMCKEMVHNVTTLIDEVALNCSKGELPTVLNPDDFTGGGGAASPFGSGGIPAKFMRLEDVWQPTSALANKVQPFATAGAGVILLVAFAAIGLRRRSGGNENRQASQARMVQQMEVLVQGVE